MAHQYIYTMKSLTKLGRNNKKVLDEVWLSYYPGAKIGVLGPNGAGKSTLLRIMAGVDKEFQGEAAPAPGTKIGYLPQEPQLDPTKDVKGNVEVGVKEVKDLLTRFEEVSAKFAEPDADYEKLGDEQAKLQDKIDAVNGWELDRMLEQAMDALQCPPPNSEVANLSGGEKRRVALCQVLLAKPDLLLLDEPTNHLDSESVLWLEQHLQTFPGTIVAVTHDRYFLDHAAGWILELDRGKGFPYEGNYSTYLEKKRKRLEQEEKGQVARQKTLERELEWVRASPKARQAKNKARYQRYQELVAESESDRKLDTMEIPMPPAPRLGDNVVIAEKLKKGFGDRVLFDGLDFRLPPGGIVGVVGPNGAGKTTLFKMIMGQEKADSGKLTVGETVQLAYVDQARDVLNGENNVWQEVSDGHETFDFGARRVQSRAYVSQFGFKGTDQQKRVKDLSGGERNRVHLAKVLRKGGNLLLLDEPTNDLDVDTLRALEDALLNFAGCAVVISHDRWFLDRVATHILAFEGEGNVVWFEGNFEDYLADKRRRLGPEADNPRRGRHRKLVKE